MDERAQLTDLIARDNVRVRVERGTKGAVPEDMQQMDHWTVTLKRHGRQLTTPFHTGALYHTVTAYDVLACLLSDASVDSYGGDFESWASDLGYDPASRKAERIYRECERQTVKLQRFLGDSFTEYAESEY